MREPQLRFFPSLPRLEDPIRAELFGIERLEQHAESLAAAQRVTDGKGPRRPLLPRVADNGRALHEANRSIAQAVREERWITPAAEWLVDNFIVVDEQLREIKEDLPEGYYRELPALADGPLAGYPRVYGLAWALVAHTDSRFDPDVLRRFVQAYQRIQPLTIGELWAVTISLRVVLVENLRRLADAIVGGRRVRQEADALADEILGLNVGGVSSVAAVMSREDSPRLVTAFAVELVQRLRDRDPAVTPALAWLHERLAAQGTTADEIALVEHRRQAASTVTVRNVITSMRLIAALDWKVFFENVSLVDAALRDGSEFAAMDFASRDRYRHAIEEVARGSRHSELEVANAVLLRSSRAGDELRSEPGYHLIGAGRLEFERSLSSRPRFRLWLRRAFLRAADPGYLCTIVLSAAAIAWLVLRWYGPEPMALLWWVVLGIIVSIPASDLAIALLNRFVTAVVTPRLLPRLEWRDGVPTEFRTLVAIPTLLTGGTDVEQQVERLEVHYLANTDGDFRFALISDWFDAPVEESEGDQEILAAARAGIARLNDRHGPASDGGPRFFIFHRRRKWNPQERAWMGWERKRGKLHELNRLLRGARDTSFVAAENGSLEAPSGVRYVLTLDADTRLSMGSIARLVGTLAHPLHRARIDAKTARVVEGFAVLQPRVTPPLPGRSGSLFQRMCSRSAGIDPYAAAVSDVYQDLFGSGSYTGKGIYDIDAFELALCGRVPENTLLSHDLFEGVFARTGLMTDVEVFESAPANYLTAMSRQHRWARGDWQLLPWILRERVSSIDRWKMIDNLRRTLSMPAAFLVLVLGWVLPRAAAGPFTAFVLLTIAVPSSLSTWAGMWPRISGLTTRSHVRAVFRDLCHSLLQSALTISTMTHQAWVMADAIVRSLWRLTFSRTRMLEWQTTDQAASRAPQAASGFYRRMAGGVVLAGLAATVVLVLRPASLPLALPLILAWCLAPWIACVVSRPGARDSVAVLSAEDALELRLIARRTWDYFTTFVTPQSCHLPPDNFQETPVPVVAQRTSPTNIGLYLLSIVSARDFGWIGTLDAVDRIEATLRSVQSLEHHRGHLFNWYETREGRPLDPRYVSSVDSGNLAGALLTLSQACQELKQRPILNEADLSGIADAALLLRERSRRTATRSDESASGPIAESRFDQALSVVISGTARVPSALTAWGPRFAEIESGVRSVTDLARELGDGKSSSSNGLASGAETLVSAIETHARDLDALLPWLRSRTDSSAEPVLAELPGAVSLLGLVERCELALVALAGLRADVALAGTLAVGRLRQMDQLIAGLERSVAAAMAVLARLDELAALASGMVARMEFGFLFDSARMLFSIGYRVSDDTLDPSHYDLLASEARLLSFVAIAKGDVSSLHWFRLGRLSTPVEADSALLSWSGSMFEYLMPALIMQSPVGSLLEQACRLAVVRQIAYGKERGVPWGISESGYFVRDLEMTFQYTSFGVPGLGMRRGLGDDIVIAPYATALAAMFDPLAALSNLRVLANAGADGRYGYFEALDYTPRRLPVGVASEVVRTYMAHHQGMTIVAIANALNRGAMRTRFHTVPMVRACELLLQERTPRDVVLAKPQSDWFVTSPSAREQVTPRARHYSTPHSATPKTQLLCNGRYAVMLTAAGSGYSRWRDIAITRWREDATRDDTGSFIFLRDAVTGERWSPGFQPTGRNPESYDVAFAEDRAEFTRRDGAIVTRLEVIVSSEDDAEVRRVSLSNHGARPREIDITSYAEIVLASAASDAAHQAFSNLFVETECVAGRDALLATRRRRAPEDEEIWLAHVIAVEGETVGDLEWETDRAQFIGRGRDVRDPAAESVGTRLSNTTGAVLDPIVSLRRRVRVRPGGTVRISYSTLVATSRSAVLDLADKYHDVTTFERVATLAWTQAQVQLHHLGIGSDEAQLFQVLGGSILYVDPCLRAVASVLARRDAGVTALWIHGISGDLPIVLVEIDDHDEIGFVDQLLRGHVYWRMKRLGVDLVVVNTRATSYVQDLQTQLETSVRTSQSMALPDGPGSQGRVIVLRADMMTVGQLDALRSVARIGLSSRRGTLAQQVASAHRVDSIQPPAIRVEPWIVKSAPAQVALARPQLEFDNGYGGFADGGREYVTIVRPGRWTPAPWINVIANPSFGCLISEAGAGVTWSINSQENRLTAWSNDPVSDPPSEMFYVRDEESGEIWSPTPLPIGSETGEYVVRHGHGYTRFEHDSHGVSLDLLCFVAADDPIKISRLTLENPARWPRRLTITAYLDWVLGVSRTQSAPYVITEWDAVTGAMFARNSWSRDFSSRIAFADLGGAQTDWTADRAEFIGRNGTLARPAALVRRRPLSKRCGAAVDPCCALQTTVTIPPQGSVCVDFFLGEAQSREHARELIRKYRADDLDARWGEVTRGWDEVLHAIEVETPDRSLDILLNEWLLYQTLAARLWARTAFYQSGGAYGFRDQLQDAMAVAVARPDLARAQLLRAAAHQFTEGDVQHWWHEPAGRGVRTRIRDDLLWLPFVTSHYLAVSDDRGVLDEVVSYLEAARLKEGQTDAYGEPRVAAESSSLFEHCARAIDLSLEVGAHGLPLMGSGDWNDGMNRVGAGGRGESVWLAWFLHSVLEAWSKVATRRGETSRAERWETHARALAVAVEREGWDGEWYRRAFFDDGTPLGTSGSDACAIDSIAQSWSVLSGVGDKARAKQAMASLDRHLVRRGDQVVLLLAPPFDKTLLEPGYIKGYVPGVRENGGQYTHAAVWAMIAFAELGEGDHAYEIFSLLDPIRHAMSPFAVARYRVEPYVVAGDVYSEPPHVGRGGWTWYTGAAGWLYRAGTEWLLGIRIRGSRLEIDPCIPKAWPGFRATVRYRSARYEIVVENPGHVCRGIAALELDGIPQNDLAGIALATDRGVHQIRAVLVSRT